MNIVWVIIMLSSIATLVFTDPGAALVGMVTGATDAVTLALNLVALYGLWLGLFEILESTGISAKLSRLLRPLVRFLFRGENEQCNKYIAMNISANLLGLGNAATPMGIGAIGTMLPDTKRGKRRASQNMIMFLVISATSLQIFPSTVIGMRAAAGSINAADFLLPCIAATVSSTVIGVLLVKTMGRFFK